MLTPNKQSIPELFKLLFKELEMPKKSDIKKALETILGYELTEEAVELIQLTQIVASFTRSDSPGEAS